MAESLGIGIHYLAVTTGYIVLFFGPSIYFIL